MNSSSVKVHQYCNEPSKAWVSMKQNAERLKPMDPASEKPDNHLRFVCISDTHGQTMKRKMVDLPPGDVLLHGGDFTKRGGIQEVLDFNHWLGTLPYKHKVVICGNHELTFDPKTRSAGGKNLEETLAKHGVRTPQELLTNCTYLQDSSTEIEGIKIYGSPWQPEFCGWGFNLPRGQACLDKWNLIPEDTDILLTHGPPVGHGDRTKYSSIVGCVELLSTIQQRVKPKYHIFGHIHEDPGVTTDGSTIFINASTCDLRYQPVQSAIVFDFPLANESSTH